jgi:hypothetical protein
MPLNAAIMRGFLVLPHHHEFSTPIFEAGPITFKIHEKAGSGPFLSARSPTVRGPDWQMLVVIGFSSSNVSCELSHAPPMAANCGFPVVGSG